MPSFVIDPYLVTVPPADCSVAEFQVWIARLESWLNEVHDSPFEWRHFLQCTYRLQEIGRFPTFQVLRDMVRARGLDINIRHLMVRIASFFQDETRDILASTRTRFALVEEEVPEVIPAAFVSRNARALHDDLMTSLVCLACDRLSGESFARSIQVVTAPFQRRIPSLEIRGTLALTEPDGLIQEVSRRHFHEVIPLVYSPEDFQTRVEDILEGGFDVFRAGVVRLARRLYRDVDLLPFTAGPEFWDSLWDSTINTNHTAVEKLLRICAAMVANRLDDVKSELRPVRSSVGPQSAQRVRKRDGARGWRLIITKKGIGWRLHYWHVPARLPEQPECLELANVVTMNEVPRIPE